MQVPNTDVSITADGCVFRGDRELKQGLDRTGYLRVTVQMDGRRGARPLDVRLRNPPEVDPTAERFAAMELT